MKEGDKEILEKFSGVNIYDEQVYVDIDEFTTQFNMWIQDCFKITLSHVYYDEEYETLTAVYESE